MAVGNSSPRTHPFEITRDCETSDSILSSEACAFLVKLHEAFAGRVAELLQARLDRQARIGRGELPNFLPETRELRESSWRIAGIPQDLLDRRVEITGPASDRKMVINALNSGAKVYMADFEDAHSPTWEGTLAGQANLRDAVRRSIEYTAPDGKRYRLAPHPAVLMARPRGWHLPEKHFRVGGHPIPAALFDFGLYLFHNARPLLEQGSGPYFYLPKLENHREARLWNEVFDFSEAALRLPKGCIKATVLIETILAVFEMHEILHELREHSVGLNCGRWDYIFSFIKKFRHRPDFVLPERAELAMTTHFLRSYSRLVIQTCHRRGVHAMGGMAAQIPVRDDPAANAEAFAKVQADKEREAHDGHDGTWVAHPALVGVAMKVFDALMPGPNQIGRRPDDFHITRDNLLRVPEGRITEAGVRNNVGVALRYLAAWLAGRGAVPIHHLMEDAATAEIARGQLWQWLRHPRGVLDDGRRVTASMFRDLLAEEQAAAAKEAGFDSSDYLALLQADILRVIRKYSEGEIESGLDARDCLAHAARLLRDVVESESFVEFLTLPAYELLP